jgi:hypothetical protein
MAKSKARRNVIIVAVLFSLMGAFIVYVKSFGGPPLIGPEPEEIGKTRLSSENAYFQLEATLKMLPPVAFTTPIGDRDFERGPLAELLDVYLKEDAPEIAAAIEGSRPAVATARKQLRMPHLLIPIDWKELREKPFLYYDTGYNLIPLATRIFLVAVDDAKAGAHADAAVQGVLDYYRLLWRFIDELGLNSHIISNCSARASLIQQCPPEFQSRLLPALVEFRAQWQPPKFLLDTKLRIFEARRSSWALYAYAPIIQAVDQHLRALRARPLLARNYSTLQEVCGYTFWEYREWEKKNLKLAGAANLQCFYLSIEQVCMSNSLYLMELDGLCSLLAVEQYKRDRGQYPESLEDLAPDYVPKSPIDPFSGQPFIYRRDGDDYRLYATGFDGRDDGGRRYHCTDVRIHMPPDAE